MSTTSNVRQVTLEDYTQRILRVLVHVQQHLDDDLPLDVLARIANFSPFHFHRIFRGMTGETLKQHVRRLRLERAACRLRESTTPITEIAFEAGYESHEAFTRAFRAAFEQSPSAFRDGIHEPMIESANGIHYQPDRSHDAFSVQGGAPLPGQVQVRDIEAMRIALLRHVGPYVGLRETWNRIIGWAAQRNLLGPNAQTFGMLHDDPKVTPAEALRYDACVTVDETTRPDDGIEIKSFEVCRYAVVLHVGPYEESEKVYTWLLGQWFPRSGVEPADAPCLEFYLNSPKQVPREELRTDVCVPIAE